MPRIVRYALEQQLRRSKLFQKLDERCRRKTGAGLEFISKAVKRTGTVPPMGVPLKAGVIDWGVLCLDAAPARGDETMARSCLEDSAREIQKWLNDPGTFKRQIIPGSVSRTTGLLRARFRERITLADAAGEVGLSRERLSRLFHESLGITFSQYLRAVRLKEACRLLQKSPQPIHEIGFRCGYRSVSQFNRAFRAVHGCSPREFRNREC